MAKVTSTETVDDSEVLASLAGYAAPSNHRPEEVITTPEASGKHKSKSFFKLSSTLAADTKVRAAKMKKKEVNYVDAEITKRSRTYRRELPPELSTHIDEVREFFLREIAPKTLAVSAGSKQAREVAERIIGSDIDSQVFARFDKMVNQAMNIRMSKFIAEYFELPPSTARQLIDILVPARPQNIVFPAAAAGPSADSGPAGLVEKKRHHK